MQIKPEQLIASLRKQLPPVVWISGDEALLMQEACDGVRRLAKEQGFSERQVLDVGPGFDWNQLLAANSELSLFAERKLIDLRLGAHKVDEAARAALMEYLERPNPDNLLLLTTGRIDKQSQSTKWFKQLESAGAFCQLWPVSEQQLPAWIGQRLAAQGIRAEPEALQLLADRVEGNLLAAAQEADKLRLLVNGEHLDVAQVQELVADNARYSVFALIDTCLAGNGERALRILSHLRGEGEELLYLLTMLCREIRALAAMQADLAQGQSLNTVLQTHRVWGAKQAQVSRALQAHRQSTLLALLERARRIDQSVKGLLKLNEWDEISALALRFSDPRLLVGVI
ncbi:MAG: DNA polymerase III subunit delta [Pseudomonadales bacterium]|jgi:DNA polymerase-3 subunit delta|nr:DNA polymerase III subunit delta [Pseudomonadales bacterium]